MRVPKAVRTIAGPIGIQGIHLADRPEPAQRGVPVCTHAWSRRRAHRRRRRTPVFGSFAARRLFRECEASAERGGAATPPPSPSRPDGATPPAKKSKTKKNLLEPREEDTMSDLARTALERHSTRMFLPRPVPRDLVNEALTLA